MSISFFSSSSFAFLVLLCCFVAHHHQQHIIVYSQTVDFTTPAPPTTTPPPLDRRAALNIGTDFNPVGGTSTWASTTVPSGADVGRYMNISRMRDLITSIVSIATNYNVDRQRIVIHDEEVVFDETNKKTSFVVHFLEQWVLTTTTTDPNQITFAPAPTTTKTTTTAAPNPFTTTRPTTTTTTTTPTTTAPTSRPPNSLPDAYEIGWYFRNHVSTKTFEALNPPYGLVPPAAFFEIPVDTPAPPTQFTYTPIQTIDPDSTNSTSFVGGDSANAEIIAIVVSMVLGTLLLVCGILAFKGWYDNKKLNEKPSGLKWHKGGRDGAYAA
jgi:hypothetical protein